MMYADHTAKETLTKEIQNLQAQLQGQLVARQMLEKEVSQSRHVCDAHLTNPFPKQADELIKEIAVLELEVAYLEKYILSLYHKTTLAHRPSEDDDSASAPFKNVPCSCPILPGQPIGSPLKEHDHVLFKLTQSDSTAHRSQSSLSHRSSSHSNRIVAPMEPLAKCDSTYHSLPLSMLERVECSRSNTTSLGELLLRSPSDHYWETPNWISEEMIKSISGIYCELAEPPLMANHYIPYSSSPSLSGHIETWGSNNQFGFSTFNSNFYNPFSTEHLELRLQADVVEVKWISRDRERLKNIGYMLRGYRSLVHRLRQVDPSKMKHEEKLAFWINVHNSLGMHAILVHGNLDSKLKRTASLLKAAYNVGGHAISLDLLRNFILECKLPLPGQWLRLFFRSRRSTKVKDVQKAYAIDSPEHRLPFALSLGSYSDPAVRVYRPEKVFKELKAAREEYLQSNISLQKDRVLVPKLVQNYAKNSGLCLDDLLGIVLLHATSPDPSSRVQQSHRQKRKPSKFIQWIPHNFEFRYLLSNELA